MAGSNLSRIAAALAAIVLLAGCSAPAAVEPGDGPATSQPTEPVEPSEPVEPAAATFGEKYVYPDGLEVEVTKVEQAKMSGDDVDCSGTKAGTPYTNLTVRVRNGTDTTLDVVLTMDMSAGPDGQEIEYTALCKSPDASGKLPPGKARTESRPFLLPAELADDVVLEVGVDMEHESALFIGPLR